MVLLYKLRHGQQGSQFTAVAVEHPDQRLEYALHAIIMDIKGVYLNSILQELIYMNQPEGFEDGTG
jgi:hypothetical protein